MPLGEKRERERESVCVYVCVCLCECVCENVRVCVRCAGNESPHLLRRFLSRCGSERMSKWGAYCVLGAQTNRSTGVYWSSVVSYMSRILTVRYAPCIPQS